MHFYYFSARSFLLSLSKLKFWQQRQIYQPCWPTPEMLGQLPSALFRFLITKRAQNQEKYVFFFKFSARFFLLTLSKLKFWKPRQLYQPCGSTHEVLRLLPSSLLHCLITKRAQNQEKRAFLLVFRSFILLTLSYLNICQPYQFYQPCGPTPEVLKCCNYYPPLCCTFR